MSSEVLNFSGAAVDIAVFQSAGDIPRRKAFEYLEIPDAIELVTRALTCDWIASAIGPSNRQEYSAVRPGHTRHSQP